MRPHPGAAHRSSISSARRVNVRRCARFVFVFVMCPIASLCPTLRPCIAPPMSDNLAPLLRGVSPRNLHPLRVSDTHTGAPLSVVRFLARRPLACPRVAVVAGHGVATDHARDVPEWWGVGCAD